LASRRVDQGRWEQSICHVRDLESERELLTPFALAIVNVSPQSIAIGPGLIADLEQMRYF
jgi:hypothetical protein